MEVADYVAHLRREGGMLADAAARAGLDAAVPTCPEWSVRDLVRHVGDVHRWATAAVTRGSAERMSRDERAVVALTWPDSDDALPGWYADGLDAIVAGLDAMPDDAVAFTFLPATSARAHWARRQAHETAIHRADAELASGPVTAYEPAFATDGIDEVVRGFGPLGAVKSPSPCVLRLEPVDVDAGWVLRIGVDGLTAGDSDGIDDVAADLVVRGTASDLYLLMWNRCGPDGFDLDGDASVLSLWRELSVVRWSGPSRR